MQVELNMVVGVPPLIHDGGERRLECWQGVKRPVRDQISGEQITLFMAQIGEILPLNVERSFSGFLVRKDAIIF